MSPRETGGTGRAVEDSEAAGPPGAAPEPGVSQVVSEAVSEGVSDVVPDPAAATRAALARARRLARDKGLRPGMKPPVRRARPGTDVRSGPDRDGRDPALIGENVERLLADRGWQADLAVGSVTGRWAQIVGPQVAAHVRPVSFQDAVLTVQAESTAWATQMRLLSSVLLGRLADEVGPGTVVEIAVLGPAAPRWNRGRRRVAGRGPRDTYG